MRTNKLKKSLLLMLFASMTGGAFAQTDVTSTYLVNPSFETGTVGKITSLDGWTLPSLGSEYMNISLGDASGCDGNSYGVSAPSDGDKYFFNRKGWSSVATSLSQKVTLPSGKYYLSVDYKGIQKGGTTSKLGFAINGKSILTTQPYYAADADKGTYATTDPWKTIGAWFDVSAEGEVTIAITETLEGGSARADLYLDNVKLYQWSSDDEVNYSNASTTSPMDVTAKFVTNPYFDSNTDGWTSTTDSKNKGRATNQGGAISGGFWENWHPSAKTSGKMYQSLTGLENGKYKLTAAVVVNSTSANVSLYIGNKQTKITSDTPSFYSVEGTVYGGTAEIGLVLGEGNAANWIGLDNVKLEYLGYDPESALVALATQIASATFTEKHSNASETALQTAITAAQALVTAGTGTKAEIETASANLSAAVAAVNASIADYANLNNQIAIAEAYKVVNTANETEYALAITDAKSVYNNGSAESCAAAIKSLTDYKVADYTYVMTNYTEDASLGDWTNTYDTNLKTDEGYDSSTGYYDLWHENSQPSISQTVTLPKGKYALIGIGRGQEVKSTEQLSVKIGSGEPVTVDFLMKGNTGLGVNTAGEADFTTGDGHEYTREGLGQGWEYRFILFELTEESSVTLGANATLSGSWAGVYKLQVKTTTETINTLKITEINALAESAPTTSKMQTSVKTTLEAKIEAASKVAITNTKEELQTAYDELKEAVDAANISIANYKALNELISTSNACYNKAAEGSTVISTAISTAQTAYENAETDATSEIAAIKNALNTYVTANVIDVVVNGTFDSNNDGWTSTTKASGQNLASNKEGDFTDKFWENWNNGPKTGKMYQTNATALPAGDYILKIAAFGDQVPAYEGSNLYVFANDQEKAVISDVPTYYYVPFTLSEEAAAGTVEYGLVAKTDNKSQWLGIDNVSISYVSGMGNFSATEDDYKALADAIAAHTLGFEAGEYAPYNNIDVIPTLAAAKAIDPEANNASIAVKETTDALNNASWTVNTEEVNAVYDGSFNLTTKTDDTYILPIGWTNVGYNTRVYNSSNMGNNTGVNATSKTATMFAKFTTEYGTETGYTMPLKKGCYSLEFIYGGWNEKGTRQVKVYNASNNATVTPNEVTAKNNNAHTDVSAWSTYSGLIEIPADGDYILSFYRKDTNSQNQICISDIVLKKANLDVTINTSKYASFSSKYELEVPEGVEAYYASEATGKLVKMTKIEDGKIPANTGVILKAAKGEYTLTATTGATAISGNLLVAVTTAINGLPATEGNNTNYVLSNGKFVTWTNDVTTNVAAGKAYLSVPSSSAALGIDFGDATAINTVNATAVNGTRVNLAGQAVGNGYKGIVIENGKKILVK